VSRLKPATNCEIIFTNTTFENVISSFVVRFNLRQMCRLKLVYYCWNMSEKCLYYLYVFDIVGLVGLINENIDLKCTESTTFNYSNSSFNVWYMLWSAFMHRETLL